MGGVPGIGNQCSVFWVCRPLATYRTKRCARGSQQGILCHIQVNPYAARQARLDKSNNAKAYEVLLPHIRKGLGHSSMFTSAQWMWACALVQSRATTTDEGMLLVPVLDKLNYAKDGELGRYYPASGTYRIQSTRRYAQGEQIYYKYASGLS